jgi:hypothetical protein
VLTVGEEEFVELHCGDYRKILNHDDIDGFMTGVFPVL